MAENCNDILGRFKEVLKTTIMDEQARMFFYEICDKIESEIKCLVIERDDAIKETEKIKFERAIYKSAMLLLSKDYDLGSVFNG